jgi:CubicO group peptidase (beta-lactamase class C family)
VQNVDYGYLWWLKYLDAEGVRYYGKAAQGNGGQRIFIFPEQNMVVVTTGGNYNTQSPADELIRKYILPSFNKHSKR